MKNPIKIAYITSGVVGVPYTYSVLMRNMGMETTLYRNKSPHKYGGCESGNPLFVDIKFLPDNKIQYFLKILSINNEYDIVHLSDGGGIFTAFLCGFGKAKVIYHFHGSSIREGLPSFTIKTKIKKFFWKHFGIKSKVLVSTADLLEHWNGAELLLDPIDQAIPDIKATPNIEQPYILASHYCNDAIKGTYKVFSAWNMIKPKFPNFKLHVVKWGIDKQKYIDMTKNDPSVIWHDFIPREEFFKLMAGATVNWGEFVIPAYGLTELEAFKLGVADITGADISDIDLANQTEKLIRDVKYRTDYIKNQSQIVNQYDPTILVNKLYNIYMNVLKGMCKI
jgi:glycosyltransferase involved in cell wall biosynthesis